MNVPKLRFKEFDGEWEYHQFSEIVNRVSKSSNSNILPKVEFEDIVAGEGRLKKNVANKFDDRKGTLFQPNNILYGKLRPYLKNWLFPKFQGVALGDFWVFEAVNIAPAFLYALIQSENYQRVANDTAGTKMPRSDWKKVSTTKFAIPTNVKEQEKIGNFFEILDKKIQLQQQKIDLLQEQKKGYMQKLLPELNELIPKKRFEGFTDNWSICKIKEICKISTGKGNTQDKVEGGTYPFYVRSATIERSNDFLYDQEAVLTIGDGVGTGKVFHYVNGKYNLHQRVYRMYNFENTVLAKYFYYYFSENFYRRVMAMTAKTSVDSVRMDMIAEMDIKYPSLLEQKRIVEFFNKLDNNIKLQEKKLELLQQKKQGFMQQMFI